MTKRTRPPFRADHVGSLLRPESLLKARADWHAGRLSADELRAAEDAAVKDVIAMQEGVGLKSVTDGDYRRDDWFLDFIFAFEGVRAFDKQFPVPFSGGEEFLATPIVIADRIKYPAGGIGRADVAFLAAHTRETAKVCIPAPTMFYSVTEQETVVKPEIYPDPEAFWYGDLGQAYRDAIADYYGAGCRYIQLDDVNSCFLCDHHMRDWRKAQGLEPDTLLESHIRLNNAAVANRPDDLAVCVHMCRGNFKSEHAGSGGYDPIAERYFSEMDVDGFFMEYDDERAGDFAPLRYVPKGKMVVLGLVTSKRAALEPKDELKRRIDEASRYIDIDQLALSPQCGFASTQEGNRLTLDEQRRKLEHIVKVAEEVWGG